MLSLLYFASLSVIFLYFNCYFLFLVLFLFHIFIFWFFSFLSFLSYYLFIFWWEWERKSDAIEWEGGRCQHCKGSGSTSSPIRTMIMIQKGHDDDDYDDDHPHDAKGHWRRGWKRDFGADSQLQRPFPSPGLLLIIIIIRIIMIMIMIIIIIVIIMVMVMIIYIFRKWWSRLRWKNLHPGKILI